MPSHSTKSYNLITNVTLSRNKSLRRFNVHQHLSKVGLPEENIHYLSENYYHVTGVNYDITFLKLLLTKMSLFRNIQKDTTFILYIAHYK